MTYGEALRVGDVQLLPIISALYGLEGYEINPVEAHTGGRNVVYRCEKEGDERKILRVAFLPDRSRDDLLGEVEYVRYLHEHGGSVANVITSRMGNLVEEVICQNHTFYVCLFERAAGKLLVENQYRYREGAPLSEYFYNCGKTLGKLHQLSKTYVPVHDRYHFLDKYNAEYIDRLLPDSLSKVKEKLAELIKTLESLKMDRDTYGMVHFDFSDGNYTINFDTGEITVFDFDNACHCWYLYDLANLWTHGVGWIQFERDPNKRIEFMNDYFDTVLAGYRSETKMDDAMLDKLPLFIQVTLMESVVDAFEVMRNNGETPECDEELSYTIACLENDIPYSGFFHEIYSCDAPFECEARAI